MMKPCPVGRCDGSGMLDIYVLKTIVRHKNGSCYVKKERLQPEQATLLEPKLMGSNTQEIYTGSEMCECRKKGVA